jgi:hypothetical protein
MSEYHRIVGEARGEPLPAGQVGVCLRVPLSGCPSVRWSRDLSARLTNELTSRPAVGHLRLNEIVRGDHIVLEGVEENELPGLADALWRAVDATNAACEEDDGTPAKNMAPNKASEIAKRVPKPDQPRR